MQACEERRADSSRTTRLWNIWTEVLRIPLMLDAGHEALHEMMHDWALSPGYMFLHVQRPLYVQRLVELHW